MPKLIQCHSPNGSVLPIGFDRLKGSRWLLLLFLFLLGFCLFGPLQPDFPAGCGEVRILHHVQPLLTGEFIRSTTAEHYVLRVFHHPSGGRDGIFYVLHTRHGTGFQVLAIHDGGIQLMLAGVGEYRPFSGVEERIILQKSDNGLYYVQGRLSVSQHFLTQV